MRFQNSLYDIRVKGLNAFEYFFDLLLYSKSLEESIKSSLKENFKVKFSLLVTKLFRSYNRTLKASAALYTCIRLVCFSSDRLPFPRRLTGT